MIVCALKSEETQMALKLLLGSLGLAVGVAVTAFTGGAALPVLSMVIGGTLVGGATEGAFYTVANVTNGEWNADDYCVSMSSLSGNQKYTHDSAWDLQDSGTSKYLEQLNNLSENKINHIINGSKNSNHGWETLVPDKNWNDIKNIIANVMDIGAEGTYKLVFSKKAIINEREVEVMYTKLSDGTIRISDVWVKQ